MFTWRFNQTDYLDDLDGDGEFGQLMALLRYDGGGLGLLDVFARAGHVVRDPLFWFRSDDYLQVELEYHF